MWVNATRTGTASALRIPELQSVETYLKGHNRPKPRPEIAILGIVFDHVTLDEATQRMESMIRSRRPHHVVTANVDFLIQARDDADLRRILLDADLVLCDGTPLVWASRVLGNPLPERVAGADLVPKLIETAARRGYRLFFLGGSEEASEQAIANIKNKFPEITIAGYYSPPFCPLEKMDNEEISRRIREARPDILFVSFGCPKAEKWIAQNHQELGVPVTIGVGATIDFLAGRMKRAPRWMQRSGLEWVFRLCQEPRRLVGRYGKDLKYFGWDFAKQCLLSRSMTPFSPTTNRCIMSLHRDWQYLRAPERLDLQAITQSELIYEELGRLDCILDVSLIRLIDSSGVAFLIRLQRRLRDTGRRLMMLSPNERVERTLKEMRVWDRFTVVRNMEEVEDLVRAGNA